MNGNVPQGTVDAARALLAEANQLNVHQVHEVVLRDIDANEDDPRVLHLIPLGAVIGVVVTKANEPVKDEDILFVSASALGNAMPALGFTARTPATYLVPPPSRVHP